MEGGAYAVTCQVEGLWRMVSEITSHYQSCSKGGGNEC
jgi:hypothetical protein